VNVRFTSSLTPEDENLVAPAVLTAVAKILDLFPIAYMIRIDTEDGQVYQHSGQESQDPPAADHGPLRSAANARSAAVNLDVWLPAARASKITPR